MQTIFR